MELFLTFNAIVTSTLHRAIWHTIVHHSSTDTYVPNFIDNGRKIFRRSYLNFFQVQGHVTQKLGQISKIRPDQI